MRICDRCQVKRAADTLHFDAEDQRIELCAGCKQSILQALHSPDEALTFEQMPKLISDLSDQVIDMQEKLKLLQTEDFEPPKKKRGRPKKLNSAHADH